MSIGGPRVRGVVAVGRGAPRGRAGPGRGRTARAAGEHPASRRAPWSRRNRPPAGQNCQKRATVREPGDRRRVRPATARPLTRAGPPRTFDEPRCVSGGSGGPLRSRTILPSVSCAGSGSLLGRHETARADAAGSPSAGGSQPNCRLSPSEQMDVGTTERHGGTTTYSVPPFYFRTFALPFPGDPMTVLRAAASAAFLLALASARPAWRSRGRPPAGRRSGDSLVRAMAAGDFAAVAARFDDPLRAALPAARLEQTWRERAGAGRGFLGGARLSRRAAGRHGDGGRLRASSSARRWTSG